MARVRSRAQRLELPAALHRVQVIGLHQLKAHARRWLVADAHAAADFDQLGVIDGVADQRAVPRRRAPRPPPRSACAATRGRARCRPRPPSNAPPRPGSRPDRIPSAATRRGTELDGHGQPRRGRAWRWVTPPLASVTVNHTELAPCRLSRDWRPVRAAIPGAARSTLKVRKPRRRVRAKPSPLIRAMNAGCSAPGALSCRPLVERDP